MAGIIEQKSKIFGNIAAVRTLAEGLPSLITNPSFPSINNDTDSVAFLTDMLKSLVGIDKLREVIVDTLSYNLDSIEIEIKTAMKSALKELVNCGVDPSIPAYIKSSGSGIKIETSKIDFFEILKTDPISPAGNLIYYDTQVTPLTSSNDFNTFLYGTIQADGTVKTWGQTPQILDVRFDSSNLPPTPNNTLTFNANADFNSKTLTEFNNTYIDSIDLFDSTILLNKILDEIFGSLSLSLNKTTSQIIKEEQIKMIIQNIVNVDNNEVVDDSYFTFTTQEVATQEDAANWRKKGVKIVETCGNVATNISFETIEDVSADITSSLTNESKKDAISSGLTTMSTELGLQAPDSKDAYALELNFTENLIQNIIVGIVSSILSPKIITIFLINYKIVYGINEDYIDAVDFLKQNKNLLKDISKAARDAIIDVLLKYVLKEISTLVASTAIEINTEKAKNKISQILSLVGIPQDVIRLIKGL